MNVMREVIKYFKRYTPAWIAVYILAFLQALCASLLPQLPQLIVDRIINPALGEAPHISSTNIFTPLLGGFAADDYSGMFLSILAIFVSLLLFRYVAHYVRWNIAHSLGVRAEKDMRQTVMRKLLRQNNTVLNRYTAGDLMSINNSDPVAVKDAFAINMCIIFDQFLALGLACVFLSMIHWALLIIPLFLGITSALIMVRYIGCLRKNYNIIRESSAKLNSCIQENINGVRIVRAFGTEQSEESKFALRNDDYRDSFMRQTRTVSLYNMWFNGLGQLINFASTVVGVVLAVNGKMSLGQFTTFLAYVGMINGPLMAITNSMSAVQNAMICGKRMFMFANTPDEISDPPEPAGLSEKPSVTLRDVCVALDGLEELKHIDLDIEYGKRLGIMGKTGSGKSVLLKTLPRFFDIKSGEHRINGRSVRDYAVEDVRRQFSYVMQDVFLFSDTVESNIAFFDPDASHETVAECARLSQADDFVTKLSDGYDTIVGERGLGLSGGQKQRVSIARALLKDAPILMLDDCTSALDMDTERKIIGDILAHYGDRTLIISSHRATSVESCDEIIFMQDGEIAERGTFGELMEKKGLYYDVYMRQSAQSEVIG